MWFGELLDLEEAVLCLNAEGKMSPLASGLRRKTENRHFKDCHDNAIIPTGIWIKWIALLLVVSAFGQVCVRFPQI